MIIWGVIAVLAIVTFVAAYFSSRTWHWANVTVCVLLFLSTLLFTVLGAKVILIRAEYGRKFNKDQAELEEVLAANKALQQGVRGDVRLIAKLAAQDVRVPEDTDEIQGILDLNHRLHLVTRIRGRVWRNAEPAGPVEPDSGIVPVAIPFPTPHGIDANTVVFVFEQGAPNTQEPQRGPQYLGEFRVVEAAEGGIRIQPVLQLDDRSMQTLQNSRGPWAIHETMPVDRHEVFAGANGKALPEEVLRRMLPPQSVAEYIRHGTPATADDDEWHRAWFDDSGDAIRRLAPDEVANTPGAKELYDRPLRDYANIFPQLAQQRVVLLADGAAVTQDIKRLQEALASAKELTAYRTAERGKLRNDLDGISKERQTIESHLATLQRMLENGQQLLELTIQENLQQVQQGG